VLRVVFFSMSTIEIPGPSRERRGGSQSTGLLLNNLFVRDSTPIAEKEKKGEEKDGKRKV